MLYSSFRAIFLITHQAHKNEAILVTYDFARHISHLTKHFYLHPRPSQILKNGVPNKKKTSYTQF